jgi:hypothetical protein
MNTFELTPIDGRKSFYKKCRVEEENGICNLISYTTKVASINQYGILDITKNENHLTQTTLRHINSFLSFNGIDKMTKKQILAL